MICVAVGSVHGPVPASRLAGYMKRMPFLYLKGSSTDFAATARFVPAKHWLLGITVAATKQFRRRHRRPVFFCHAVSRAIMAQ
jgi:hypothetical protein